MKRVVVGRTTLLLAVLALLGGWAGAEQASQAKGETPAEINKGLGSRSAPVTIEVFSDYQCPACRELYVSTLRPLIANYVSSGKVFLVHRDMPLAIHAHAREAARYANAAAAIGKLERVVEALYANQHVWSANGDVEAVVAAALPPAEMRRVRELVRSERVAQSIDKDVARGQSMQVRSTPSVFVTHRGRTTALPPGGVNYPLLRQYIDHLLRQP